MMSLWHILRILVLWQSWLSSLVIRICEVCFERTVTSWLFSIPLRRRQGLRKLFIQPQPEFELCFRTCRSIHSTCHTAITWGCYLFIVPIFVHRISSIRRSGFSVNESLHEFYWSYWLRFISALQIIVRLVDR